VTELRAQARRWLDGPGDVRALALLRIAAGPLVILHLRPFLETAAGGGSWDDGFWVPFASWYPTLSGAPWRGLLWAAAAAAVLLSAGAFTRPAAVYTLGFVTWNLFLSQTHFHHNRAFLVVLLFGLAALPVGGALSVDAVVTERVSVGPLWPLLLVRFSAAAAYWASGLSKLLDADWWGGTVLRLRIERYGDRAAAAGVPDGILDLLASPGFMWGFAKVVVLTELVIGFGLLARRTRLTAVWLAIWFHIAIELTADVQVFSLAGLSALVIWVAPRAGDRVLLLPPGNLATWVRRLDWTGRFTIIPAVDSGITLCDRGGVVRHGAEALRMVLSRLPLAFPLAAPLLLPGVRAWWDRR
jgi:hypothetical protein